MEVDELVGDGDLVLVELELLLVDFAAFSAHFFVDLARVDVIIIIIIVI